MLRLGPSAEYALAGRADPDQDTDSTHDLGSLASLDATAELTLELRDGTWLVPRLKGGLSLLFPDHELDAMLAEVRELCAADDALENCDSLEGTRFGFNFGAGVGVLYALSESVRLRTDAELEWTYLQLYSLEDSARDQDLKLSTAGARIMLMGGMEF